jgi:hypothetical protein
MNHEGQRGPQWLAGHPGRNLSTPDVRISLRTGYEGQRLRL